VVDDDDCDDGEGDGIEEDSVLVDEANVVVDVGSEFVKGSGRVSRERFSSGRNSGRMMILSRTKRMVVVSSLSE
jgi:hypothetical protein